MSYTGQRKIAFDAGFDDALFGRPSDNPYSTVSVPGSAAAYDEGYSEGLISSSPPRGPKGDTGAVGARGGAGPPGADGVAGSAGTSMFTGAGAPSGTLGNINDVYIDSDTGQIYKKTGVSTWTLQGPGSDMALAEQVDFAVTGPPEIIYKGEAVPGALLSAAAWRIRRITLQSDDDAATEWADGNDLMDNVWNNRAALSYS